MCGKLMNSKLCNPKSVWWRTSGEHNLCGWYGVVPGRIRAAAAAVGIHVPAKASSHSVSSSARAGDWRPNPCTDLERKEWLAILKKGPRRSK